MSRGYEAGSAGHVLITGASSGLGAALARAYAAPGVRLALQGRDDQRLQAVAETCRGRGADVRAAILDVTDRAATEAWVLTAAAAAPIDLVVANAGVAGKFKRQGEALPVMATNVLGVVHTVQPLLPGLVARGRGQIALVSSIAGFRGTPQAAAYCASKAAVRVWGEGLRARLRHRGVLVSVVCPGFVATPMTAGNARPMPFIISAERAASIIVRGLARDRARIGFPWPLYLGARLFAALPAAWGDRLIVRLAGNR